MDNPEYDDGLDLSGSPERVERTVQHVSRSRHLALPDCMRRARFDCTACELADPSWCLIAIDRDFASYLRHRIHNEMQLRNLIRQVIKEHGRPIFRDIIAAMVQARRSDVPRQLIYSLLSSCPADFAAIDVGVYGLAEWSHKNR